MNRVILCYHQVAPVAEAGRSYNIEPKRLESHITFFLRRRFSFTRARDVIRTKGRSVCFTFDDAYTSTLTYGLEVLQRCHVTATIYAVPSCVGTVSAWDVGAEKPLADWDHLLSAERAGFEIGNHTMRHKHLDKCPENEEQEWAEAHQELSHRGFKLDSACYPYGGYTPRSPEILAKLGYSAAYTVDRWPGGKNPYLLARIVVAYGDALPMLLYRMHIRPLLP